MKPEIVLLFENLLWACSPKHWTMKFTYYGRILYVSATVKHKEQHQVIRRQFTSTEIINVTNLYGFVSHSMQVMKTEEELYG